MNHDNLNQRPQVVYWVRIVRFILNKKRSIFLKILAKSQGKPIFVGSDFSMGSGCNFRSAGEIFFENHVGLASQLVIETNLFIGQGTIVSSRVAFIGNDHSATPGRSSKMLPNPKSDIKIGSNCWIGYGAIIIGSVSVCSDVIIGAGSVVTRDITEPGVYTGAPARKNH
jgi:acetyltransferase-like isoleucine patch superfamily enzyme